MTIPFRRAQIAPFNAQYPELNLVLDPNNYEMQKVIVQSLAGVGPDLFDCYNGFQLHGLPQSRHRRGTST
jgi:hypothetical protein